MVRTDIVLPDDEELDMARDSIPFLSRPHGIHVGAGEEDVYDWLEAHSSTGEFDPARKLLAAVLIDAIEICRGRAVVGNKHERKSSGVLRETEEWIFGHCSAELVTSFSNICEVLGLDPNSVRKHMKSSAVKKVQSDNGNSK